MAVPSGPVWLGSAMSRQAMPTMAAWIDDLREAFGKAEIDAVIRAGLKPDCEPRRRFFAGEAGQEVGRRWVPEGVEVSPVLPEVVVVASKRGRQ